MIGIVEYGSGNVEAISGLLHRSNIPHAKLGSKQSSIHACSALILPGVGAFDTTMELLEQSGLLEPIERLVLKESMPILGICVGMQVLADRSEEGEKRGLGWIPGFAKKFRPENILGKPKVPHLGWNSIRPCSKIDLFDGIDTEKGFYFLHSYHFVCTDDAMVISTSDYGGHFASAVRNKNIYGVQFHPEKSHQNGIRVFENFYKITCLDQE